MPEGARIGVDPTLYSKRQWDSTSGELKSNGKELVAIEQNLVDEVWEDQRPACGTDAVFDLGLEFSGKKTDEKVENVRKEMEENEATVLLVTELDEVACT